MCQCRFIKCTTLLGETDNGPSLCRSRSRGRGYLGNLGTFNFVVNLKLPLKSLLKYYKESRIVEITKL